MALKCISGYTCSCLWISVSVSLDIYAISLDICAFMSLDICTYIFRYLFIYLWLSVHVSLDMCEYLWVSVMYFQISVHAFWVICACTFGYLCIYL